MLRSLAGAPWRRLAASIQVSGGDGRLSLLGGRLVLPPAALELPADAGQAMAGPLSPLQARWAKKSKRKKAPKMADRTKERLDNSGGPQLRIFDQYLLEPETTHEMSRTIRGHMRGLTGDGRWNTRRKRDLARYTNYRVMRVAGLTHDFPREEVDRRGFVTPLTELQETSNLPRSPMDRRFLFPHSLSYKVYWGPPSVMDQPNEYEGSMVGCTVAVRLEDLPLTQQQKERLVDIVGASRYDEDTGVVALEADYFPERNHNAAMLGDMLEKLLRDVTQVGDGFAKSE